MAEKENEYTFREGGEADFEQLADLLRRHDYGAKGLNWSKSEYMDWLKWKYLDNPDGPARIWIIEDSNKNIVGFRANLPRWFACPKTGAFRGYHGVDLLIDAKLRGKGLYAPFRDFVLERLDFPSISFPRTFLQEASIRRGRPAIGPMMKWWFPVAAGRGMIGKPWRFIAPLADVFSRGYAFCWLGKRPAGIDMRPVERFRKDFDVDTLFIHGVRSANYLNWRFVDNRMYDYSAFEFLQGGECFGYCVYKQTSLKAEIFDFVIGRRHRGCLRLFIEHLRSKGIVNARFRGIGLRLGKFGFIPRRDMLNHCKGTPPVPRDPWMLTLADRDY